MNPRIFSFIALASLGMQAHLTFAEVDLPVLGDTSSAMVSPVQEKILGQRYLKYYRSQVPTSSDPLVISYLEALIKDLLPFSQIEEKRIDLVVVKNDTLNAFAVPGGIMGVHTGIFNYAKTEDQLAAVISHEMGHLSQRHYARGLEQQKNSTIPMIAGMIAGLAMIANNHGDSGMAAIMGTQAATQDAALRFSRDNESEADRIGEQTMIDSQRNPYAAADMFEEMLHISSGARRPPEYLLTHPASERRVADARNRAMGYPRKEYADNLEYQLMRSRIRFELEETPQIAVKRFKGEVDGETSSPDASRYGLALAYSQTGQFELARTTLKPLLDKDPKRITYLIMSADIDIAAERYKPALDLLESQLKLHPDNYPLTVRYGEALMKAGLYAKSAELLERFSRKRKDDDYVWYLLAEVNGLNGNILGVHQARAEYYIANGVYDKAQLHLRNAVKLAQGNVQTTAILEERQKYVQREMIEMRNMR